MTRTPTASPRGPVASARRPPAHHRWIPRQHGAWAMLVVPILLGVAASRNDPWQLVLGAAALAAYLLSATAQAWSRARRAPEYRAPLAVYGTAFGVLGLVLVVAFPALVLVVLVGGPASAIVFGGARPGTRRDLVNSLAQVAQALTLVPAAAWVSGAFDIDRVVVYTAVAAAYLGGSVLAVRSVLAERGNVRFAAVSVTAHAAVAVTAGWLLPAPYLAVAILLLARAAALPVIQRRLAGGDRPLKPVHVGLVEIVASVAVVAVALGVPI